MNVNEMTRDECRDELARMDGWVWTAIGTRSEVVHPDPTSTVVYTRTVECAPYRWIRDGKVAIPHPYEETLDGAAAALPEGWDWSRANGVWRGWHEKCAVGCGCVEPAIEDTEDEIADRYRLALACVLAMEKTT